MPVSSRTIAGISSTSLRGFAYLFLRWIPGHHFPPLVLTSAAIYFTSFVHALWRTSPYNILADEVEIVVKEGVEHQNQEDVALLAGTVGGTSEELNVQETMVVQPKPSRFFSTLVWGTPSPSSRVLSIVTAAINFCLVLMTLDMVYTAAIFHEAHDLSFARVGFVSDSSAKVLVREPELSKLPIFLSYRQAESAGIKSALTLPIDSAWKAGGQIDWLSNATDYTSTLTIHRLLPDTLYQYAWSNNHSGYFVTAPPVGRIPSHPARGGGDRFTFLHSSCIIPRFPYFPFANSLSIGGLKHLAEWMPTLGAQFMLFLGDFIYIDVPIRHGSSISHYRRAYRQVYASPDWPAASAGMTLDYFPPVDMPWIHVLDDHEIANDWDMNTTGVYDAAVDPFMHYHIAPNPPPLHPNTGDTTYTHFTQGPTSIFLMDTRRYRSVEFLDKSAPISEKTMLGSGQRQDLLKWLKTPLPSGVRWKIVISSVPFTKNWRFGFEDTWGGYLSERKVILEAMWDAVQNGDGVVVLSGDRHEFAATRFDPPDENDRWGPNVTVTEFSTGPLSQFYLPIRTYSQQDQEDVALAYLPDGNSKFGAVEIRQTDDIRQSLLSYRLFIDGTETWSHNVTSPARPRGLRGFW
ncbi:Metallo-dependent phosphatase [Eremomyces bilateralis CBS 781.70]|uniref:Metallo-dependent phosphatase n=1 Tax=Eremomyces bilateralis CBS 781.70 TaxID=1392243 RepID=A0A6G1GHW9_9PEZI|nr:Metallo-dependent phosphatase [Eremomyces bilateralis CBS 781.70]KAF1817546.1 Metallo-dependent phosphatase [Eremomyces bilateralis CBS 781.70]